MSRIGPIVPLLLQVDPFRPIRETIKLAIAANGIEKMKTPKIIRITMVSILDGYSFPYAQTWSKSDISIC